MLRRARNIFTDMAKSQRSNRQKALRTQRAQRSAEWVAEAEAKRLEALQQCIEAPPAEITITQPEDADTAQDRGREGAAGDAAMAVDKPATSSKKSKGKKKGVSVAKGIKKKKGSKAILAAQFSKKQRKQRR